MDDSSADKADALVMLEGQRRILEMIATGSSLDATLNALVHFLEALSADMLCSILLLDADGVHVRHGAAHSLPEEYNRAIDGMLIGPNAGSCGTAAFRREPIFVENIDTDPLWKDFRELALKYDLRACWSTPIFDAQRVVLGTFAIYHRKPMLPQKWHLDRIAVATHLASIAIGKQREESALKRSEERLSAAQTQARIGSWEIDLVRNQAAWSQELYRVMRRDPKLGPALLPEFTELVHPEDRAKLIAEFEDTLRTGFVGKLDFRTNPDLGPLKYLTATSQSFKDGDGKVIFMTGTIQDISERKQSEADLLESEDRYARALRGTSDGLWDWHILTGEHYLSGRWKQLLGFDTNELQPPKDWFIELIHPDDLLHVRKAMQRHFSEKFPFDEEFRLRSKQGDYKWVRSRGIAERNERGQPVRMAGAISDIADRKRAEASLQESERRLKDAQSLGDIGDWQYDLATGEIRWSDVLFRLFERDRSSGPPHYDENMAYYFPEDAKRLRECVKRAAETGESYGCDLHLKLPSGKDAYHEVTGRTEKNASGQVVKLYGTAQDITDRKQAEAKLKSSEDQLRALLGRFHRAQEEERTRVAREIHDELGQLLTGLKMDVRWIERKLTDPDLPPRFSPVLERIVAASELTDATIAAVQKIAADLRPGALDKLGLAAALMQRARRFQERTAIPCVADVDEAGAPIPADVADELFYICQEALTNVARHANPSRVDINLKTDAQYANLEIRDDGVGIQPSALNASGSLGLLGMKERTLQCGGTIDIAPRAPHGTRVYVQIPLRKPPHFTPAHSNPAL